MKQELRIVLPPFEPGEQYRYLWCLNRDQPIPLFALKPGDKVIVIREEEAVEEKAVEQVRVSVVATAMPISPLLSATTRHKRKYPGVFPLGNKWRARHGQTYLGIFDTEEEAWEAKCQFLMREEEEETTGDTPSIVHTEAFQHAYNVVTGREES